jgi:hypothetical protein
MNTMLLKTNSTVVHVLFALTRADTVPTLVMVA